MNKKIIITALSTALLTSSLPAVGIPVTFAASGSLGFKDTTTHWGKAYIEKLQKEGYAMGSNGYFKPNETLKTEDFLIMALKVVDPTAKDLKATEGQVYYEPFVARATEIGLIKPENDEVAQFIEKTMPRELAVKVVERALTLKGEIVTADHGLEYKFKDFKSINDLSKEAVLKTYQLGLIKGSNGNFNPKNPLTRAEAAVLVSKLMDKALRDKMIFGTNFKTYDPIAEWYLTEYDKTAGKRTVVIEKKADGSINDGDVDFKEIRKWWTDQEFEDKIAENIASGKMMDYSSGMVGSNNPERKDLNYTSFSFYVHDGEIAFVNEKGVNTKKAYKHYEANVENFNRLAYDLTKYATQFASEKGLYAVSESYGNYTLIGIGQTAQIHMTSRFNIVINYDAVEEMKSMDLRFPPVVRFDYNGYNWKEDEVFIKQAIYRIYGKDKGEKAFQFIKASLINRNFETVGTFYKTDNGIQYFLTDIADWTPVLMSNVR